TKTISVKGKLESWSARRPGLMACFLLGLPKVAGSSPGAARAIFFVLFGGPFFTVSLTLGQNAVGLTDNLGSYSDACVLMF
ncbi:MAG: hypothetical protein ACKPKO_55965, partial [Candidatus Fonsibacter sp.]